MTNPKLADELAALAEAKAWLEAQIADYTGLGIPDAVSHIRVLLAALTARSDGWREGVEAAARACEQQAVDFQSEQYATGQPLSSIQERFACNQCATAIRNLTQETTPCTMN